MMDGKRKEEEERVLSFPWDSSGFVLSEVCSIAKQEISFKFYTFIFFNHVMLKHLQL